MFLVNLRQNLRPWKRRNLLTDLAILLFGAVTACEADPKFGLHDKENLGLALILL